MNDRTQKRIAGGIDWDICIGLCWIGGCIWSRLYSALSCRPWRTALILCALIYTYGHISGRAGQSSRDTWDWRSAGSKTATKSAYYIVAQFIGGIIAAAVLVDGLPAGERRR